MLSIPPFPSKPTLLGLLLFLGYHSFAQTTFQTLGAYQAQGVPAYLEGQPDVIDSVLLKMIAAALPEQKAVPLFHPQYITQQAETEVKLTAATDVWVTFVAEGAGWKNTLGFYTYDLNNPPKSPEQIANLTVIFPNVSSAGSGGALAAGSKVKIGHFKANMGIGWFLVADGWRNNAVSQGNYVLYANAAFNPEPTPAQRAHTVLLQDKASSKLILGFEDTRRDQGSDNDFNDVLFYITANSLAAIQTENIVTAPSPAVTPVVNNTPPATPPANETPANNPGKTTGTNPDANPPANSNHTAADPKHSPTATNSHTTTNNHNTTNTNNLSSNSNNVTNTNHNNSTVNHTTNNNNNNTNTNTTTNTANSNNVNSNNTTYNTTVINNTTVVTTASNSNNGSNNQSHSNNTNGGQPGGGRNPNGRTPNGHNRPGNNPQQNPPPGSNPAPGSPVPNTPPAGCAHNGFSERDFARTYAVIKNKPNEDVRQSTLQQAVKGRLLTVDQAVQLLKLLTVSPNRLATAKYLYDYTCEKNNYFLVSQVLTVASHERDFNAFLSRKNAAPVPAPSFTDAPTPGPFQTTAYAPDGFTEAEFESLKSSVIQQHFTDTRMGIIRQAVRGRSLTTAQDIELIRLFSFEQDKVKLAKFLYDFTSDGQNYFKINNLFSFSTSVDELNKYLSTK